MKTKDNGNIEENSTLKNFKSCLATKLWPTLLLPHGL